MSLELNDCLKRVERSYQNSWSTYTESCISADYNRGGGEQIQNPISIYWGLYLSFAALSSLVEFCYYLWFLQSFSDRKEYINSREEKAFKKKNQTAKQKNLKTHQKTCSPPQVWQIPTLIPEKHVCTQMADPQHKAQWCVSAQQQSPFCQTGT